MWKEYEIGDFVLFYYGKALKTNNRIAGDIPVYSSAGITGWHNTSLVNDEGIIIGRKGNVGSVYYSKKPFYVIDTAYYVKKNEDVYDLTFMYYLLKYIRLDRLNEDSAVPGLNRNTVYRQKVNLPSIQEQKAIAKVLSDIDDKIEINRKMNQTLEKMAKAIYKQWFVDFEFPNEEGNSYKSSGGEFENGIPLKFKKANITDIVTIKGGGTPRTKIEEYWNGGKINWTTPKDLSRLEFPVLLETDRKITELGLSKISSGLLPKGTVLMSSRAPVGYLAISEIDVAINQGYIAMLSKENVSNLFVLLWAMKNMGEIKNLSNGTTFMEVSKTSFKTIELIVPDQDTMKEFHQLILPIYRSMVSNLNNSSSLIKTRNSILPKLISGEIKINA